MVKRNTSLIVTLSAAMTIISACAIATPIRAEAKTFDEVAAENNDSVGRTADSKGGVTGRDENGKEIGSGITLTGADAVNYNNGNYEAVGKGSSNTTVVGPSTQSQVKSTMPAVRYGWAKDTTTGKWYYSANGVSWLKSSWKQIGGKWYYFLTDGAMATSQSIDGYWINAEGVWVK